MRTFERLTRQRPVNATWQVLVCAPTLDGDPDSEHFFVADLLDRSFRAREIEFELGGHRLEPVKLAFEQSGYSVHDCGGLCKAYRVAPDRAPS